MRPIDRTNAANSPYRQYVSGNNDADSSSQQPTNGTNAANSSFQPAAGDAHLGLSHRLPRLPIDAQNSIYQRQPHGYSSARQHLTRAINRWAQGDHLDENRGEAASRILRCYEEGASILNLSCLGLRSIPLELVNLPGLRELNLDSNQLTHLPAWISHLTELSMLSLVNNQLAQLPESIGGLSGLSHLGLSINQLIVLPEAIGNLSRLRQLDLSNNQLTRVPESIGNLTGLSHLDLSNNQLTVLPESMGGLTGLSQLCLRKNQLIGLPESIGSLAKLDELDLSGNQITRLPDSIGGLTELSQLSLWNNQLVGLPESIGSLAKLDELDLSDNQITQLSDSIGSLTGLSQLGLSNNQLVRLPESIGNLNNLRLLDLSDNLLADLTESIGNLSRLRQLDLSNNQLTELPQSIGGLTGLSGLSLSNNQLSELPESIGSMTRLDELRLWNNQLIPSPESIDDLLNNVFEQSPMTLERSVRRYCSHIKTEDLDSLEHTENAASFADLLSRLGNTAEGRLAGFSDRVAFVIETLARPDGTELRASCFLQAREGLSSCVDRVAIAFSDIEVACQVHRILRDNGGQGEIARLLRGGFRISALDRFARNDIAGRQGDIDDIEILMAYRVRLREALDLPFKTHAMYCADFAYVDQETLDRAMAYVLELEQADSRKALVEFAIEQPFWNTFLESIPAFQQGKQRITTHFYARLEELEDCRDTITGDAYVKECDALVAERDAQVKDLRREFTRRIGPR